MRDIKFRAWAPNCNEMWDWVRMQSVLNAVGWNNFSEGEKVIMQYSGFKDKNGKEIYESDIVYIAGQGNCEMEFPFFELYDAAMENDIGAIVGNIYEDKELLQ